MKKQTQQQRDFDQIIDNWYDAEDEVFRLQTLNMQLQQDYNRAWERLKSQCREIDELQKKLEQHERLEHEIKALFGIEMLQAVQDFADKLKTRLDAKAQHYVCRYDWNGHSAVVDCENEVDKLLEEHEYRKVEGLEKENADLLKACEEQFTFDTTEGNKYSVFNTVRKVFADEVKAKIDELLDEDKK